jgi:hypothetical protein
VEVLHLADRPGAAARRTVRAGAPVRAVALSPAADLVVAGTDAGVVVAAVADTGRAPVLRPTAAAVDAVAVADGDRIVLSSAGQITELGQEHRAVGAGAPARALVGCTGTGTVLAGAINGRLLGLPLDARSFHAVQLESQVVSLHALPPLAGRTAAAVALENGTLAVWDVAGWRPLHWFTGNRSLTAVAGGGRGPGGTPVLAAGDASGAVHLLQVRP